MGPSGRFTHVLIILDCLIMEISTAGKIVLKSGKPAIFWRNIGKFRFFGEYIGCEKHALRGALTEGKIGVFSTRK